MNVGKEHQPGENGGDRLRPLNPKRMIFAGALVMGVGTAFGEAFGLSSVVSETIKGWGPTAGTVSLLMVSIWLSFSAAPQLFLPVVGWLVDRWGSRWSSVSGFVVLGIACLMGLGFDVGALRYVVGGLFTLGGSVGLWFAAVVVVNNWFSPRPVMALAWLFFAAAVVRGILQATLEMRSVQTAFGESWLVPVLLGVGCLALGWVVSRLVMDRPEDCVRFAGGSDSSEGIGNRGGMAAGHRWAEALKTRTFWLLAVAGCGSAVAASTTVLRGVDAVSAGLAPVQVSAIAIVGSLLVLPFILVGGWLGTRFPIRWVLLGLSLAQCVAVLVQAMAGSSWMFYLSASLMGIGVGGVSALSVAAVSIYFGRRNFGAIVGTHLLVTAVASLCAGITMTRLAEAGSGRSLALAVIAVVCMVAVSAYGLAVAPRPASSQDQVESSA